MLCLSALQLSWLIHLVDTGRNHCYLHMDICWSFISTVKAAFVVKAVNILIFQIIFNLVLVDFFLSELKYWLVKLTFKLLKFFLLIMLVFFFEAIELIFAIWILLLLIALIKAGFFRKIFEPTVIIFITRLLNTDFLFFDWSLAFLLIAIVVYLWKCHSCLAAYQYNWLVKLLLILASDTFAVVTVWLIVQRLVRYRISTVGTFLRLFDTSALDTAVLNTTILRIILINTRRALIRLIIVTVDFFSHFF